VNKNVKTLALTEDVIKSDGLIELITGLKDNNTLTDVNFSNNEIGNHGAAGLAQAWLQKNESVIKLDLHHNKIKDQGAVAISTILKLNKTIQVLNFRFNEFQDTGAQILGAALKINTSLVELDLGGNL
jgi:Ran GTPase-activating protein (RanGAP) involved in mRNA processing and transport